MSLSEELVSVFGGALQERGEMSETRATLVLHAWGSIADIPVANASFRVPQPWIADLEEASTTQWHRCQGTAVPILLLMKTQSVRPQPPTLRRRRRKPQHEAVQWLDGACFGRVLVENLSGRSRILMCEGST